MKEFNYIIITNSLSKIFQFCRKIILPVLLLSFLWYSCEEELQLQSENDQIAVPNNKEFSEMTQTEKIAYVKSLNFQKGESNYIKTWIDSSAYSPFSDERRLTLRSSYTCGINVELFISGPADTAKVTVYEANTSTKVHGPVLMVHGDDFNMTVSGAKDYDFKVEPIDNPTSSTNGNFIVDPDWGSKTVYYFSGAGPHLFQDYHFECPAPELDGTCNAAVAIDKYSGSADSYDVTFDDGTLPNPTVRVTGNPNYYKSVEIDETKTYDITITINGSGSGIWEDYTVKIVRPDQISHFYNMYHKGNTTGNINNIGYFECPY